MIIPGKNSGIIDITNKFILKEIILEMLLNYKCGDAPFTFFKISYLNIIKLYGLPQIVIPLLLMTVINK